MLTLLLLTFSFANVTTVGAQDQNGGGDSDPSRRTMQMGPEYAVAFEGNETFDTEVLLTVAERELDAIRAGEGSPADLVDAAYTIQTWYRDQGFPDASVRFRMVALSEAGTERTITETDQFARVDRIEFLVSEGPRLYLGTVSFEGNDSFSDATLRSYVPRRGGGFLGSGQALYRPQDLSTIVSSLEQHYLLAGYLQAQIAEPVTSRDGNRVDVTIRIIEGETYTISRITVTGDESLPAEIASGIRSLLPDARQQYRERIAADGADRIERYLGRRGYLTGVRYRIELDNRAATVEIQYIFDPGNRAILRDIRVVSDGETEPRIRTSIVRNQFRLEPGDPINRSLIDEGRQELYQTGLFRIVSAEIVPVEEGQTGTGDIQVDLVITVEEDRSRFIEIAVGWDNADLLLGSLEYVDQNVFGTGRQWGVEASGSFRGYRFGTRLVDRFLLGLGSRIVLTGEHSFRSRDSFSERSTSAGAIADIYLSEELRTGADYEFSYSIVRDLAEGSGRPETIRLSTLHGAVAYDTVDSTLFPTDGLHARIEASVSGVLAGLDLSSVRLGAGLAWHLPIGEQVVLSLQGEAESILPHQGDEIPISERLYAGGADSVRAFGQDALSPVNEDGLAIGGLTRAEATAELRLELFDDLFLALFYDVGSVAAESLALAPPGHAIGLGVRYRLPIGPIRVDVALNPGATFAAERDWAIHFSIGSGF
jgi:outer membrane protein assembly complex protein YaeT